MRAARIYRPAELIGGKINHLQVQACHGPAKGCLLGWGHRCHTLAAQPRLGRACGRSDRGELRRSPRICPEQEGRYLGRRPAVNRCSWEEFRTQCAHDGVLFRTADAQRVKRRPSRLCDPRLARFVSWDNISVGSFAPADQPGADGKSRPVACPWRVGRLANARACDSRQWSVLRFRRQLVSRHTQSWR